MFIQDVHVKVLLITCFPPVAKLKVYRNSLCSSLAEIYNSLPVAIQFAPSINSFTHGYFKMYLSD